MLHTTDFVILSAVLFILGAMGVLLRRNAILLFMSVELMLNASNLNFVAFNQQHGQQSDGHIFALFVIIVAVCEAAVGLAIVLRVYKYYNTSVPDEIADLKG